MAALKFQNFCKLARKKKNCRFWKKPSGSVAEKSYRRNLTKFSEFVLGVGGLNNLERF
jgi:hypothetical protein